jgi:hypothetical protein
MIVRFYDPHEGIAGPGVPLPPAVKTVANELDGTRCTLALALARLLAVCPDNAGIKIDREAGMIVLGIEEVLFPEAPNLGGMFKYNWRVICFKPAEEPADA